MSGWTVITVRGKYSENYPYSEYNEKDPYQANADLVASFDADDRVREWTTSSGHVHAYLNCERYNWEFAEALLEDYHEQIRDAVVLGANDTTDTGTARYYLTNTFEGDGNVFLKDEYKETQGEDGCHVGYLALAMMNARHGIVARDPFHTWIGDLDDRYIEKGNDHSPE